jgi:hypothetical protein
MNYLNGTRFQGDAPALRAGVPAEPQSLKTGDTLRAEGFIVFDGNLAVADTLAINGTTFTAVASGASGAQFNVGVDLGTTIDNIVTVLNASADTDVDDATYYNVSDTTLRVVHDASGGTGFTLDATVAAGSTVTDMALIAVDAAVSVENMVTAFDLTAYEVSDQHFQLADGLEGQQKTLFLRAKAGAGNVVVTPANLTGGTTMTFDTVGEISHLMFIGGSWRSIVTTAGVIA